MKIKDTNIPQVLVIALNANVKIGFDFSCYSDANFYFYYYIQKSIIKRKFLINKLFL